MSTKISVKHGEWYSSWLLIAFSCSRSLAVTLAGSALFILFGLIYFYEAFHSIDIDVSDITYPA